MSRCFAFPPPGYEKKIRTDEAADYLTKEKRKEKKHKKDKKDREKKVGKEKKDKERSKEKHKEKKEKKEKHKDKKEKDRDKEKSRTPEEKKPEVLLDNRDREKVGNTILQHSSNGVSRFVQDLARRICDGEEATGSRSEQRTKVAVQKNAGVMGRAVENNSYHSFRETNHRRDDDKRINSQRNLGVARSSENVLRRECFGMDQKRVEAMGKPMEKKDAGKQMEAKEKTQHMDGLINNEKPRDNKEGVKKSEPKHKERHKEKKEELNKTVPEKPKVTEGGPRSKERDSNSLYTRNNKPPDLSKAINKNLIGEGNLGKRKDLETNGFMYENGSRPNKLLRPAASPTLAVENGRKLVANQTPPNSGSDQRGTVCKPDIKERKINGFIDSQEPKVVPKNPLAATAKAQVKENGEASAKPPHPDLKYLTQVLSIPERELPEFDGQEWLLGNLDVKSKKRRTDSSALDESQQQVWDRSLRIESTDIAALPYVVPY